MKIGLKATFNYNSSRQINFLEIFEKFVKFKPYSFTKGFSTSVWNEKKHKKIIKELREKVNYVADSAEGDVFLIGPLGTAPDKPFLNLSINQDQMHFSTANNDMRFLFENDGFVSGYLFNDDYKEVQSQRFHNTLSHKVIQKEIWDTVKNTPFKVGVFDIKEYDVKFNPGRCILLNNTWIIAAWKMWFGKEFYSVVPKERLLGFKYAFKIEILERDVIFIQLHEKIEEPYTPDSIFRQAKWLEWIKIDELIEEFHS